jgi:hypothetical protein
MILPFWKWDQNYKSLASRDSEISFLSRGRCYDHNSKQFLPILAEKIAFFSKTNVMITILHNLALFWVKTPIFCNFFRRKYLKNHNIGPRLTRLNDSLLLDFFENCKSSTLFEGTFSWLGLWINFDKKLVALHFERFFSLAQLVTLFLGRSFN